MTRVPKMARLKISIEHEIHCSTNFLHCFAQPAFPYCDKYVYISTYLTEWRLRMKYRCYQLQWNIFTQIGGVAKCWLDIYLWGAGRAVVGQISNIGENINNVIFKKEVAAAPVTPTFYSLSHSSMRSVLER